MEVQPTNRPRIKAVRILPSPCLTSLGRSEHHRSGVDPKRHGEKTQSGVVDPSPYYEVIRAEYP